MASGDQARAVIHLQGVRALQTNITAALALCSVIRTSLGPRSMCVCNKDPYGGIVVTNDGATILRELHVVHPAAKLLVDLSMAQDNEVGDGTTTVVLYAGGILHSMRRLLDAGYSPRFLARAVAHVAEEAAAVYESMASSSADTQLRSALISVATGAIGTKLAGQWRGTLAALAADAVLACCDATAAVEPTIDFPRRLRVLQLTGASPDRSFLLSGAAVIGQLAGATLPTPPLAAPVSVCFASCGFRARRAVSKTTLAIRRAEDLESSYAVDGIALQQAVDALSRAAVRICVISDTRLSDSESYALAAAGITVVAGVADAELHFAAAACKARVLTSFVEIEDPTAVSVVIGRIASLRLLPAPDLTGDRACVVLEAAIGIETQSATTPPAAAAASARHATVVLRGTAADVLSELGRGLHDALQVTRAALLAGGGTHVKLLVGGGACEAAAAAALMQGAAATHQTTAGAAADINSVDYDRLDDASLRPVRLAVADALLSVPRVLAENAGARPLSTVETLLSKYAGSGIGTSQEPCFGVDGMGGAVADMAALGVYEPLAVKLHALYTAAEVASTILSIDDVCVAPPAEPFIKPAAPMGAQKQQHLDAYA